jgi:glycosyltransferase involved in cell wall biosynthesis
MGKMRIVIDSYWWFRGTQSLQHVVHGLVETWSAEYPQDELVIVIRRKYAQQTPRMPLNVRIIFTRVWPQAFAASLIVPWHAKRLHADAMLTHNFPPLFGRNRSVLIQDMIFATNPEWFTKSELAYFRWMIRLARRTNIVFSTTKSEGNRISQFTKASRIVPVGLGISGDLFTVEEKPLIGLTPFSFMLTVGRLNIRKNLGGLLEGAMNSQLLSPSYPLVVAGTQDGEFGAFPAWVDDEVQKGHIIFTGFVSMAQIRWLIRNCSFYSTLSLDEGFGLPPVEARLLGASVLVSDLPVFHETLGNDATYVDPTSPEAIGEAMRTLASKSNTLCLPNSEFIARHSWQRTVSIMRRELLGNFPHG